jgi:hypothetical protein
MVDGATQSLLVITRNTGAWRDRLHTYHVFVDGVRVVDLKNGATVQGPVSPGTHVVFVKIDWVSSPPVTVTFRPGEAHYLECGSGVARQMASPRGQQATRCPRGGAQTDITSLIGS